jgi:hypothetical protein
VLPGGTNWLLRVVAQVTGLGLAAANAVAWTPASGKQHCRTGLLQVRKHQMVTVQYVVHLLVWMRLVVTVQGWGGSDAMLMLSWLSTRHTAM